MKTFKLVIAIIMKCWFDSWYQNAPKCRVGLPNSIKVAASGASPWSLPQTPGPHPLRCTLYRLLDFVQV